MPSTQIFDKIAQKLKNSDSTKQQAINDINGIFTFHITGDGGGEWFVDAKESGQVGKGAAPAGKTSDTTITLAAEDFSQLVEDNSAAMQLFFGGKMRVAGDQVLMMKLNKVLALGQ